jgi:formylglycine-generating enzyme required for sulfatase activity
MGLGCSHPDLQRDYATCLTPVEARQAANHAALNERTGPGNAPLNVLSSKNLTKDERVITLALVPVKVGALTGQSACPQIPNRIRLVNTNGTFVNGEPVLKAPPARQDIQPPPKTYEGELYVFISYAQPDRAVAEKVEAFLTAAGVRVFRDTHIPPGANWDMTIDHALRKCQRMVLLLSSSSMPHRKEVHREWFYFDQERKPILPLYIQDCELHTRLRAYNRIDARGDLQSALEHLLNELRRDFALPEAMTGAEKISVVEIVETEARTLPEALQALLDAVRDPAGSVFLSVTQANAIKDHQPAGLTEFRLCRIAEWSLPRHYLDKRFVNLTLLLDKGETDAQRWQRVEDFRFNDVRDVLRRTQNDPALVLLGAPGSGKSTVLRRLQLDHSIDRLRDEADQISFFIQLNGYRARSNGELPAPREWLNSRWTALYPQLSSLASLETYLQKGRALLLLDALNEMPHKSTADYFMLVGLWQEFAQEAASQGNRIVFSCRSLDYSAPLSSPDRRVPQVEVQPMNAEQVRAFLKAYIPAHGERIWGELENSPAQFELFKTPYFLRLFCEQVEATGGVIPRGRAGLFTGFVRQALCREREKKSELFQPSTLLSEKDHLMLSLGPKRLSSFDLPEHGFLIPKLSELAFRMQEKGLETEGAQIRIAYDDACNLIAHERSEAIINMGLALNVLDEDVARREITFFHQLLQEYFAARRLAKEPNPSLVHVEWAVDKVSLTLADTLAGLADGDPLPPLPQTGWEETTLTAAPMAPMGKDPQGFIRGLIPHNLPLAGRCAASPEVSISDELKREIQTALIARTQDQRADPRARIAAGEALGLLGDPRFELRKGTHGDYLLPALVEIPGGTYPMGDDKGDYDNEKPAHTVELAPFQIGQFPVTNAEYALFMAAGGYKDDQWWDTPEALAWLRGEASTEGNKQQWRDNRKTLQGWSEDHILGLVKQNRITSKQAENWITFRNWTDERFEQQLDEWYPSGKIYDRPEFWDDTPFNNPSQPVVGVTWFEARAYCNWLTANARSVSEKGEKIFRLPTEAEFEASARGKKGRLFPYGKTFDVSRSNTFESHIRRTAPVGIFDNATPEGAVDLSGNAYTWTLSIYDQDQFPYPYQSDDGRREDIHQTGVRRVLRGGSWDFDRDFARAVCRGSGDPDGRDDDVGFRVVCGVRPPSL